MQTFKANITSLCILLVVLLPIFSFTLSGCTSCTKTSVPATVKVRITDPTFQKLAAITSVINIKASGTLNGGRYSIKSVPIVVSPDTSFKLELQVPVDSAEAIDMAHSSGSLSTSKSLIIASIPAPETIELSKGKATMDVDLGRSIASFIIELLQQSQANVTSSDISKVLKKLDLKEATFALRPDSSLKLNTLEAKIDKDSRIVFSDLTCDQRYDYDGDCRLDLQLKSLQIHSLDGIASDSASVKTPDNNEEFAADGTRLTAALKIARRGNLLTLQLPQAADSRAPSSTIEETTGASGSESQIASSKTEPTTASFTNFRCRAHNGSVSGASCTFKMSKCSVEKKINEEPIDLALQGSLNLEDARLTSKTARAELKASVPGQTLADVSLNRKGSETTWSLASPTGVTATDVEIYLRRKRSSLQLHLASVQTGPLALNSADGLKIALKQGSVEPTRLVWQAQNKTLTAALKNTHLTLPADLQFGIKDEGKIQAPHMVLALNSPRIDLMSNGKHMLKLENVKGQANIELADDLMKLDSDLNMSVAPGGKSGVASEAEVALDHLSLRGSDDDLKAIVQDCRISLPLSRIEQAVGENLPVKREFVINKVILQDRKWRYRNLQVTKVIVSSPQLHKMQVLAGSKIAIDAEADIKTEGTVERYQLGLRPSTFGDRGWKEHPWSAAGHLNGDGVITWHLVTGETITDSKLAYDASVKMKVPDNLTVDWSQVAGDIPGRAEQALLGAALEHAGTFAPQDGIPIKTSGTVPVLRKEDDRLSKLKISSFKSNVENQNLVLRFTAQLNLR